LVETLEINFVSVNPKFTNIVTKGLHDLQHNDSWNDIKARLRDIRHSFACPGVLNMYPNVWLDGARPTNPCIPHWGMHHPAAWRTHPQKFICNYKNLSIERVDKLTFWPQ